MPWGKFVHRHDPSVIKEAQLVGSIYQFRRPGEEQIIEANKESFEAVYRPATPAEVEEADK